MNMGAQPSTATRSAAEETQRINERSYNLHGGGKPQTAPDGVTCWICMDASKEETPSRDCSCRGDGGFAHWSCRVQYAVNKISDAGMAGGDITKAWRECPLCNQGYLHELQLSMADAFIQMCKQLDSCDPYRYAEALLTKLRALDDSPDESMEVAREMIAILKTEEGDSALNLMSIGYEKLGWHTFVEGVRTKGDDAAKSAKIKEAIAFYEEYRELAERVGNVRHVKDAESKIATAKNNDPLDKSEVEFDLTFLRAEYERDPSENFQNLMFALRTEGHAIELERLVAQQLAINQRVLGPDHPHTKENEYAVTGFAIRKVKLFVGEDGVVGDDPHRVVRYEDDGSKFVLAPMKTSHDFPGGFDYEEGKEFTLETAELPAKIRLTRGTPVMCHGLKKAAHLNGRIGDAREYNKETQRYEVHFDGAAVEPRAASVKLANLKVVFDVPEK